MWRAAAPEAGLSSGATWVGGGLAGGRVEVAGDTGADAEEEGVGSATRGEAGFRNIHPRPPGHCGSGGGETCFGLFGSQWIIYHRHIFLSQNIFVSFSLVNSHWDEIAL